MEKNEIDYVDYVILVPGKSFSRNFLGSWTNMITYMFENNYSFKTVVSYSPVVSSVRNRLLASDMQNIKLIDKVGQTSHSTEIFSGKLKCKKVIFIDSDMVWTTEDIDRLIKSPYDVTAGIYVLSDGENLSIMKKNKDTFMTKKELKNEKSSFPIKVSGLGFVACTYEILSKLEYPWFFTIDNVQQINNQPASFTFGEDAFFFTQLSMLGENHTIMADPLIRLGHEKEITYTV